jgi:type IV pilus assembly protein PilF
MMNKASVFLLLLCTAVVGCVTESSVTDKSTAGQREVGPHEAARTRLSLALSYIQNGDMTQAKFNLMKAEELDPDSAEVANAFAFFYQRVGENELAEKAYRKAIRLDSKNADSYNNFGAFLCQTGQYAEAEKLLLDAVKKPGYIRVAESYENLGLCAIEEKNLEKATGYFNSALKHSPVNSSVLYDLTLVTYAQSQFDQAFMWYSKLAKTGQSSSAVALLRYLIAHQRQDEVERQQAQKFLLSAYPNSPEAVILLAGNLQEAAPEKLRQEVLLRQPASVPALDTPNTASTPKIKVVKRKTMTDEPVSAPVRASSPVNELAAESASATPTTAAPDTSKSAESTPLMRPTEHIVRSGETLYSIASANRLTVSELQRLNQLTSGDTIQPGQILILSDEAAAKAVKQYTVAEGDTLFSIAYRFNMGVERLCQLNQLSPTDAIAPGTVLILQDPNE